MKEELSCIWTSRTWMPNALRIERTFLSSHHFLHKRSHLCPGLTSIVNEVNIEDTNIFTAWLLVVEVSSFTFVLLLVISVAFSEVANCPSWRHAPELASKPPVVWFSHFIHASFRTQILAEVGMLIESLSACFSHGDYWIELLVMEVLTLLSSLVVCFMTSMEASVASSILPVHVDHGQLCRCGHGWLTVMKVKSSHSWAWLQ